MNADRFRFLLGWIIVAAWVCSLAFDFIPDTYAISVNGAMMLVAGFVFGPAIAGKTRARRNGDE